MRDLHSQQNTKMSLCYEVLLETPGQAGTRGGAEGSISSSTGRGWRVWALPKGDFLGVSREPDLSYLWRTI